MKKKKVLPDHDLDTLMPILIQQWRRLRKIPGPQDALQTREFRSVVLAVQALQERYKVIDRGLDHIDYFQDRELLGAYLLYEWVIHYQEGLSLINELPTAPRRVLDVCAGPAPYGFAALQHGASEVIATDRNLDAAQLGAEVAGRYGYPMTVRKWDCHKDTLEVEGRFDLIIVAHAIEELFPPHLKGWKDRQQQFIMQLLSKLDKDGYLLLTDRSILPTNHRLLSLRDTLVEGGIPLQAPCVWRGKCPALKTGDSPCYAQRPLEKPYLMSEIHRSAKINQNSLKMTYLIFRKPENNWPSLAEATEHYRVISPKITSHHGERYYLCGTDGKKRLESRLNNHPKEARAFEYLKRGELIAIENALDHGNNKTLIEGSSIRVEAALSKPLPMLQEEN